MIKVYTSLAKRLILVSSLFLVFLFPIHYYGKADLVEHIKGYYNDPSIGKLRISDFSPYEASVIFPRDFSINKGGDNYTDLYRNHLGVDSNDNGTIIQYTGNSSALTNKIVKNTYKKHQISVFDANRETKNCGRLKVDTDIEIAKYDQVDHHLDRMAKKLIEQLENDDAFKDLRGFFKDDLPKQIMSNTLHHHFFKFSGTSVWLEQHGVHYMISRVLYNVKGSKRGPSLSLTYAQVFNEKWQEMRDVELVYPTRHPNSNDIVYKNGKFPSFLPIPFYSDSNFQPHRFYGAEDPRLLLVKNDMGVEEPLMVFNAFHRKIKDKVLVGENAMNITFGFYRSMFLCWPFQYQLGKVNVDDVRNPETDKVVYNKVIELRRENTERLSIQKNWTPFVDLSERDPYDKHIYFIYRWANLEILKCKLTDFDLNTESQCSFVYKRNPDLKENTAVGPMRGGTEMIPFNLHGHTAWIGFARAHIKKCGCGSSMYRPNLAVIVKHGDEYKISYLSSSITFDIPIVGWTNPKKLCRYNDPDALIPNGISAWETLGDDDYMTLTLSVADDSVHVIHIRNLLQKVKHLAKSEDPQRGFDENAVECTLKKSAQFCRSYGNEQKKLAEKKQ
ncbi:uncharacterized protein RJT20DRAFT_126039 [Scheffersomyces xylosifermentans]|uniref:uncharacterized protein n=1 Tax=Scheffersomyces xylosifermentans TaxID=1304137 RepID=UPI00315DD45A